MVPRTPSPPYTTPPRGGLHHEIWALQKTKVGSQKPGDHCAGFVTYWAAGLPSQPPAMQEEETVATGSLDSNCHFGFFFIGIARLLIILIEWLSYC
jgi:hypothetical protein